MLRVALCMFLAIGGCSEKPRAPTALPAPVVVSIEPDVVSRHVIKPLAAPAVPPEIVVSDLAVANTHLHEADRYVAWTKSKPRVVDNLTPLTAAVARAARRVEADRRRRRVSVADEGELRRATSALDDYLHAKGD